MIGLDIVGLPQLQARVSRASRTIQPTLAKQIATKEVPNMARKMPMRAARYGRLARAAATTVTTRTLKDGAQIEGGGTGQQLGNVVFLGAEFGGRKRRKSYASRSRRGTPFIVSRRRTTMQFHPHLGTRGYWFYPTIRAEMQGLDDRLAKILDREFGQAGASRLAGTITGTGRG